MTKIDPQSLYVQLGELIATMPDLSGDSRATLVWVAKAQSLLWASGNILAYNDFRSGLSSIKLGNHTRGAQDVFVALNVALLDAERAAPVAARGAFIPVAKPFDALTAIGSILREAKKDTLVVDP